MQLSEHHMNRLLERIGKARMIGRTPHGVTLDEGAMETLKFTINSSGTEFAVQFCGIEIGEVDAGPIAMAVDDRQAELEWESKLEKARKIQEALDAL